MKKYLIWMLVFSATVLCSQTVGIGSDIYAIFNEHKAGYSTPRKYSDFPYFKGASLIELESAVDSLRNPVLLYWMTDTAGAFWGAYDGGRADNPIYIDSNCDGILDYKSDGYILPALAPLFFDIPRGSISEFSGLLEQAYQLFDSMAGPKDDLQAIYDKVFQKFEEPTTLNRDLFFAFSCYMTDGVARPVYGVLIMKALIMVIEQRFSAQIPLLYLFLGEAYHKSSDNKTAEVAFRELLQIHPQSRIGRYYIAEMRSLTIGDDKDLSAFKKEFPDFWYYNR